METVAKRISDDGVKDSAEQDAEGQAEQPADESEECADPELGAEDLCPGGADTSEDGEFVDSFGYGGGHSGEDDECGNEKNACDGDIFEEGGSA